MSARKAYFRRGGLVCSVSDFLGEVAKRPGVEKVIEGLGLRLSDEIVIKPLEPGYMLIRFEDYHGRADQVCDWRKREVKHGVIDRLINMMENSFV